MEDLQRYIVENGVEDLILEFTEMLLKEKPQHPKKFLLGKLEESIGDGISRTKPKSDNKDHPGQFMDIPASHLTRLFESTRAITAEIVPKTTIDIIIRETAKLLCCDRVSMFVYNPKLKMLILTASNLAKPIRVQPGQGISGHVFQTQETINIPDCYQDPRFDSGFDKLTGYHTKGLLTMPILDFENEAMGVLQAINKEKQQSFNQIDELLLGHLTQHAGIALRNAEVYRDAIVASERANGLLHVIQALSQDLGMQSTILTITMHASELVQADRCSVFLVDEAKEQLWSVTSDSGKEIRIPRTAGIAGECASAQGGVGTLINIPDAYQDPRFNQAIDRKTGYHTQSMLCVPIRNSTETKVMGVIQMINKLEFDGEIGLFMEEDVEVLETFSKFVGERLHASSLLGGQKKANMGDGMPGVNENNPTMIVQRRRSSGRAQEFIVEEEENDE